MKLMASFNFFNVISPSEETNEVRFHFKTDVKGRAIEKAYLHVYIDT